MILPQVLPGLVRRSSEDPNKIPSNSSLSGSYSGVRVTDLTAMQQATVWSCVYLLADTVSNLPVGGFRKVAGARQPIDPDPILLREPSAGTDMATWLSMLMVSLLLRGNAYGLITTRDNLGYPTQIEPLHPDEVTPRRERGEKRITYRLNGEIHQAIDIMHVRGLMFPGMIEGLNPIQYARQTVGLALASQEYGAKFFGESAHPSGILEAEGDVSDTAAQAVLSKWETNHANRSRRPALLTGGLKWKPISLSPEESQFLETRGYSRSEIAGFFRVPPHMVGDMDKNSTWGRGVEEIGLQFATYTLQPWIGRFEKVLTSYFPRPQYVKFNISALLRTRTLDRYQAYLIARQAGFQNADEIRELEEYGPIPDGKGKEFSQPLNWGPLGFDPTKKGDSDGE